METDEAVGLISLARVNRLENRDVLMMNRGDVAMYAERSPERQISFRQPDQLPVA